MTPGMIHDLTLSSVVAKARKHFAVKGDGSPMTVKGDDAKDLQYWNLGRMMMHHRNLLGGFDKLVIAGLPAYRAVENMQCLTGSGLTVPVESYTGFEMNQEKFLELQDFYEVVNRGLPQFRKIDISLSCEGIVEGLAAQKKKFNVFDFDFMVAPNLAPRTLSAEFTAFRCIKKEGCFVHLKEEEHDQLIQAIKATRRPGPTAVYCNWAFGRQMSGKDWQWLRRGLLRKFERNFEVVNFKWTDYVGNSHMVGLQLILGATKKAPKPVKVPKRTVKVPKRTVKPEVETFATEEAACKIPAEKRGAYIRELRIASGLTSEALSRAMGYSHARLSQIENHYNGHHPSHHHLALAEKVMEDLGWTKLDIASLRRKYEE